MWLGSRQYVLSRQVSDHYGLLIKDIKVDWRPKPFESFDVWEEVDGFKDVVKKAWD